MMHMPELLPEAVIILLDASRSMFRADYEPNRLEASKRGIMNLIHSRHRKEAEHGGNSALATIQDVPHLLTNFNDYLSEEKIQDIIDQIFTKGASPLGDGIGFAIKALIEDIRTSGARIPRIMIFSDGKSTQSKVDPLKMGRLAKQMGIRIDTIRLGDVSHHNMLSQIAQVTGGTYFFANNASEIMDATTQLAMPNIMPSGSNYRKKSGIVSRKVLKKIAVPLRTESEMKKGSANEKELISRIRGTKSYQKCGICFQSKDPISQTGFNISGRYCSSCGTPMHFSCASKWGLSQDKDGDGTVFRCVHCLYLSLIPVSVQTAVQMHQNVKKQMKSNRGISTFNVTVQIARKLGESALYSACPVCSGIFEEDDPIIKCGNPDCNAIYHLPHFEKLPEHICKVCGSKLVRLFDQIV
jgi:hypothetical protein